MATKVEEAIAEIDAILVVFLPEHEGLRDFARLNLTEQTQEYVRKLTIHYDRRAELLFAVKAALLALLADGHPELPTSEVDAKSYADLRENSDTILAALSKFRVRALATDLNLEGGTVGTK